MKLQPIEGSETAHKTALSYILDAFDEAASHGVRSDQLATAALFTALSALVDSHGEEAVCALAERLAQRVANGEFTLARATH